MSQKGILTDSQRDWIRSQLGDFDGHRYYTARYNSDMKRRIENGSAAPENIRETVLSLSDDLELLDNYFRSAKPQPQGKHQWNDEIRPLVNDAMKKLGDTVTWLSDIPEGNIGDEVRNELRSALQPLREDLSYFQKYDNGKLNTAEESAIRNKSQETPEAFLEDMEELQARREGLNFILGNNFWIDLLLYINETPESIQKPEDDPSENKIDDRTWKMAAGQELKKRYGLIDDGDWGYVFTRRGEAVLEAYQNLLDNEFIKEAGSETGTAEAALHLLYGHFSEEVWDRPADVYE